MVAEARARVSLDGKPFLETIRSIEAISDKAFGGISSSLKKLGGTIAAAFTVGAIKDFAMQALQTASTIDDLAKRLNISAESVQSLGVVAKDSGLSMENFEGALLKITTASTNAQAGNQNLVDAFSKLGISVGELNGLNPEKLFERVAKAMADGKDDATTLAAAYDIIGENAGPKLTSELIKLGEEGFDALNERMRESGRILTGDTVASLESAEQKVQEFTDTIRNKFVTAMAAVIEVLQNAADENYDWITPDDVVVELNDLQKKVNDLNQSIENRARAIAEIVSNELMLRGELAKSLEKLSAEQAKNLTLEERIEEKKKDVSIAQSLITEAVYKTAEAERLAAVNSAQIQEIKQKIVDQQNIILANEEKRSESLKKQKELQDHLNDPNIRIVGDLRIEIENKIQALLIDQVKAENAIQAAKNTIVDLTNQQKGAEKSVAEQTLAATQAKKNQTDAQVVLLQSQRGLNTLLKEYNDTEASAQKARLERLDRIKALQDELAKKQKDFAYEQLSNEEKLALKQKERADLLRLILGLEMDIGGESETTLKLKSDLVDLDREIASLAKQSVDKQDEAKKITKEQVEAVQKLRDLFAGMTEGEIEEFKMQLQSLSEALKGIAAPDLSWLGQLRNIGDIVRGAGFIKQDSGKFGEALAALAKAANVPAPNLDWLDKIKDLDLGKITRGAGFRSMDATQFGEALASIAKAANVKAPDLSWLEDIKNFKIPKVDTASAGKFRDAIRIIVDSLIGLQKIDASKLEKAAKLIESLKGAKPGKFEIEVKLPGGWEQGIPLDPKFDTTLKSIDKNLTTLAGLKGVVWV